jgi:hypothetical protein
MRYARKIAIVDPVRRALRPASIAGAVCLVLLVTMPLIGAPDEWAFVAAAVSVAGITLTVIELRRLRRRGARPG